MKIVKDKSKVVLLFAAFMVVIGIIIAFKNLILEIHYIIVSSGRYNPINALKPYSLYCK